MTDGRRALGYTLRWFGELYVGRAVATAGKPVSAGDKVPPARLPHGGELITPLHNHEPPTGDAQLPAGGTGQHGKPQTLFFRALCVKLNSCQL